MYRESGRGAGGRGGSSGSVGAVLLVSPVLGRFKIQYPINFRDMLMYPSVSVVERDGGSTRWL